MNIDPTESASVLVALVTLAGVIVTTVGSVAATIYSKRAHKQAQEANKAVNCNQPGSPRLYDMMFHHAERIDTIDDKVDRVDRWLATYEGGPLENGKKAVDFVTRCDRNFKALEKQIRKVDRKIDRFGCPYRLGSGERECGEDGPAEGK